MKTSIWQSTVLGVIIALAIMSPIVTGVARRCWSCRSRGEYGDCRDPFQANTNNLDLFPQVDPSPCASGWCAKIIEGNDIQYSVATERLCLQRPPEDGEERCAETEWTHEKVYMCFCMGDLCNAGSMIRLASGMAAIMVAGLAVNYWMMTTR